jgi:hypothetical protein
MVGAAAPVVPVNGQIGRLFSPAQIPRMHLQVRQHKTNDVTLNKCFIRSSISTNINPLLPEKIVVIAFEVPIAFRTID